MIDSEQLKYWLALWRISGIGPARFAKVLAVLPELEELFTSNSNTLLKQCGFKDELIAAVQAPDWGAVEQDLQWAAQPNCHIITLNDSRYPYLLRQIADPPPLLFVRGDLAVLNQPQLAMVGSRNASPAGFEAAQQFAAYFAQLGMVITSGLALGIDAASHQGALSSEKGKTIAVMGTGPNHIYPGRHQALAARIAANGALVTEYPLGIGVKAEHFPRRNRIISGLATGVVVIEAALNSGSLITARMALEQGREVFALPGSVHNPMAKGCHALIKQGAKLVETAQDVLEEISGILQHFAVPPPMPQQCPELPAEQAKLLACLDDAPTAVDVIVGRSGLTIEEVSSMLLLLELNNLVASVPGGYMRKSGFSGRVEG